MREDFIAGAAVHQRRRDIAHGAGGHEDRGFLAEQIRDALLQGVDGGVVADLFVADLGVGDGFAHAGRRPASACPTAG